MIQEAIGRHRGLLALASLLSGLGALATIALLTQIARIASEGFGSGTPLSTLVPAMACVGAVLLLGIIAQSCLAHLNAAITSDLREHISQRFLALDYATLQEHKHVVAGALIVDVSRVAQMLLLLPQASFNLLVIGFCLVYMAMLSLPLLGVLAAFVLIPLGCSLLIVRHTERIFDGIRQEEDRLFGYFRAIADAKKEFTLNAARARHFSESVLGATIRSNGIALRNAHRWWGYNEVLNTAILYTSILAVAYAGRAYFAQGETTTVKFVIASLFLSGPIGSLIGVLRQIVSGMSSVRHLRSLGSAFETSPVADALDSPRFDGWVQIALRAAEYRYPQRNDSHDFAFGPVDLEINRGETLFVVGGNGSGKSTLALLITRMLTPTSGGVFVDGRALENEEVAAYQQNFTAIFADYQLFEHVIDRRGETPQPEIMTGLLRKLGMNRKVAVDQGKFSTLDLSQGQKKRLALAQGYIEDSEIYVFDEWAADQDAAFRRYFYLELLPELKAAGKTLIVITHDDRYFACADRLIHLEHGRIAAGPAGDSR